MPDPFGRIFSTAEFRITNSICRICEPVDQVLFLGLWRKLDIEAGENLEDGNSLSCLENRVLGFHINIEDGAFIGNWSDVADPKSDRNDSIFLLQVHG